MWQSLLWAGIILSLSSFASPARAEVSDSVCAPGISMAGYDPETVNCYNAFCALPQDDRRGVSAPGDFAEHVVNNSQTYTRYEEACFKPISGLKQFTRDFLRDLLGALFYRSADGLVLTCSAFRIATGVIITARHCISGDGSHTRPIERFVFRVLSAPAIDMPVTGEVSQRPQSLVSVTQNDFEDLAILRVENKTVAFGKTKADFKTTYRRNAWLLIGGMDSVAFVLGGSDINNWASSYRYADVAGAQWIARERLPAKPPSEMCLLHGPDIRRDEWVSHYWGRVLFG
jgi:hypothetical protein